MQKRYLLGNVKNLYLLNEKTLKSEGDVDCFLRLSTKAIVHYKYLSPGQTNKEYYLSVLKRLRSAVHRKWLEMWTDWKCEFLDFV